jgi:diguanylate cyclase (GGDEF)-like protein/PAS domain S-box-containing protein
VTESVDPARAPDAALDGLLAQPEAVFCALADDGFRIDVPASLPLREAQIVPVPVDRATMVDLVVPDDRMTVILTWERARTAGVALGTVRTPTDPDRPLTLTILDARARHGVWVGALSRAEQHDMIAAAHALAGALAVPLRPRTATIHKTMFGVVSAIDERTTRMLGWTPQHVVGVRSLEFIHPDDQLRALSNWMEMLSQHEGRRVRYRHRCRDGSWLWVEVEHEYRHADAVEDIVVVAQVSDISDEMAAHEEVRRREQLFHRLAESLPTGVMQVEPDGRIAYANARVEAMLGVAGASTLAEQLAHVVHGDRAMLRDACDAVLDQGVDEELEVSARLPGTGEIRRCRFTLRTLSDDQGSPGALICVSDVTDSARMREELKIRATFDVLTGCYNRGSVIAALDDALEAALLANRDGTVAVIFVDLDHFKPVNDELGHAAGDALLVHTADAIKRVLRSSDIVGRFGGDEFLILCQPVAEPAEACTIAERIAQSLHHTISLADGDVRLSASVGVAFSGPGATSESLVARADVAMYESKRQGDGLPVVFGDHLRHLLETSDAA